VNFNEDGTSNITITGFDGSTTGLSIDAAANSFASDTDIDAADSDLDAALTTLRSESQTLSSGLGVVNTRQEFTKNMINSLTAGADSLTLADPNEEGANMLALQTRQQLSIVALSLSSQAQQSVLRLF
jgi:flagellin